MSEEKRGVRGSEEEAVEKRKAVEYVMQKERREGEREQERVRERWQSVTAVLCWQLSLMRAKGGREHRPRRQTTPRFRGEATRGQAGSFWLHSFL